MKVKDLIKRLQEYDPEMEAVHANYFGIDPDFREISIEEIDGKNVLFIGTESA